MLIVENLNANFNGISKINEEIIATMNASYSGDNTTAYFNFVVNNITLYLENKEAVDTDFIQFKNEVFETLQTMII